MDQEISKATWLGAGLMMLVGAIAAAVTIFGLVRTMTNTAIDEGTNKLLTSSEAELSELSGSYARLTKASITGLIDRCPDITYIYFDGANVNPATSTEVNKRLNQYYNTTYTVNTQYKECWVGGQTTGKHWVLYITRQ